MPPRVDFQTQRDFTGGLFLNKNGVQVPDNATSDCLNVDLDGRGGFYLRRGVAPYYSASLAGTIHSVLDYTVSTGTAAVLVGAATGLYRWTGAAWTSIFTGIAGPYRAVTFKDRIYVFSGNNAVQRWDGTTNVALGDASAAYNNNLAAPTVPPANGNGLRAKVAASFKDVVVVANTYEGGVNYPARVRWSHPDFPEDWFNTHYIDIGAESGDEITALVPYHDGLLVFKHNSIHVLEGLPPTSFSVSQITRDVGATSQEAVVATDVGVFFWDEASGLHKLETDPSRGTRTTWVFEPLWPAIEDGSISVSNTRYVQIGHVGRRIWVSVPWESGSTRDRTFVYDPFLGKKGAWTAYDVACGPFLNWSPPNAAATPLAASTSSNYLLELEKVDRHYDDIGSGAVHIESHYMTRWYDGGEAIVKKRWKRPEFILLGGQDATIPVSIYKDFDPTFSFKNFNLVTTADGTQGVWDTSTWDNAVWGREGGDVGVLLKGSQLGNAKAIALKFTGPSTNVNWRVDALTMKWVSKRVRN